MSRKHKRFASNKELDALITQYFEYIKGESHIETKTVKALKSSSQQVEELIWDRHPEPPTFYGLALFLGFSGLDEFESCKAKGKYAFNLRRGHSLVQFEYEKRLHTHYSGGAVFALKSSGWYDCRTNKGSGDDLAEPLQVNIIHSGPGLAYSEKEVII